MTAFLKSLEIETGKICGVPLDVIDRLVLGPITGDKYEGQKMVLKVWDLTNWEICPISVTGQINRFNEQPRNVKGGMLLLLNGETGIMGGGLIVVEGPGKPDPQYTIHENDPADFNALYQVVGRDVSRLSTTMVYRDADEGKRNAHQPMGEFLLMQREAGGNDILAGNFANTNSMSARNNMIAYVAFRARTEIDLERK